MGQRASAASAEDRSASVAGSVSSAGQWYVVLVDRGRSRASDGVLLARPIDYGSGISARALGPQQQAYVGKSVRLEGPREQPALCATVCEILDRVVIHLDRNARFVSTASSEGWPGLTFSACSCSMSTLTLESLPTRLENHLRRALILSDFQLADEGAGRRTVSWRSARRSPRRSSPQMRPRHQA